MSDFRLLAFDLDGTMLNAQGRLDPATIEFLQAAQSAGVHCVGATGRRLHSALPILRGAGLQGFTVTQNGAVVADVRTERTERCRTLAATDARAVVELLEGAGLSVLWYCHAPEGPGELYVVPDRPDPSGFVRGYLDYARGHYTLLDSLGTAPAEGLIRLTAHHRKREPLEALRPKLAARGPGLRSFVGLDPVHRVFRLEVLHVEASKWAGVQWVAERLRVPLRSILAVGDDANDADLLHHAGHSLAAPGATPAAVESAREQVSGEGPAAVVAALRPLLGLAS